MLQKLSSVLLLPLVFREANSSRTSLRCDIDEHCNPGDYCHCIKFDKIKGTRLKEDYCHCVEDTGFEDNLYTTASTTASYWIPTTLKKQNEERPIIRAQWSNFINAMHGRPWDINWTNKNPTNQTDWNGHWIWRIIFGSLALLIIGSTIVSTIKQCKKSQVPIEHEATAELQVSLPMRQTEPTSQPLSPYPNTANAKENPPSYEESQALYQSSPYSNANTDPPTYEESQAGQVQV